MSVKVRGAEILQRLPAGTCRMAEIGVWEGALSELLLRRHAELRLVMVDRWAAVPEDHRYYWSGAKLSRKTEEEMLWAWQKARLRVAAFERAEVMRGESVEMAKLFGPGSFDQVFLDANHMAAALHEDLVAWYPTVKAGGWISGHDWRNPIRHGKRWGVSEAVEGFMAERDLNGLQLGANTTWFLRKP